MKKSIGFLCLLYLCLNIYQVSAQVNDQESPPEVTWAKQIGGNNEGVTRPWEYQDLSHAIVNDDAGNTYIAGCYIGEVYFGDVLLNSGGLYPAVFVAKYDSNGSLIWVRTGIGSPPVPPPSGQEMAWRAIDCIALDNNGNVIVGGRYFGTLTIGDVTLPVGNINEELFVAKYTSEGDFVWARAATGRYGLYGNGITTDLNNNVIVAGSYGHQTYGGDVTISAPNQSIHFNSPGGKQALLIKYDSNGNLLWARENGGSTSYNESGSDDAHDVVTDPVGNIFIIGAFYGTAIFDHLNATSNGREDIYIAKYNSDGIIQWVKSFGGPDLDRGYSIEYSSEEAIYISGIFAGTSTFGSSNPVTSNGDWDVYIAKFTTDGMLEWVKSDGGTGRDYYYRSNGLTLDQKGNPILTGMLNGTVVFGDETYTSNGQEDIFVIKYDTEGNYAWSKRFGGPGFDMGHAVSVSDNNTYITGAFSNTVSFGDIDLKSNGLLDIYLVKMGPEEDIEPPIIICPEALTIPTVAGECSAYISIPTPEASDNVGIETVLNDYNNTSDASDIYPTGSTEITWTATDLSGNTSTCEMTIVVVDEMNPIVVTQNITVPLDESGNATITPEDVDAGSTDACGILSKSLDVNSFSCSDVGIPATVILTVTDVNGNTDSETAVVTVEDNIAPAVLCKDITIQLNDDGLAGITATDIDGGSTDACGIASLEAGQTAFNCNNIGINAVTLSATDNNGNISTCTANVTVTNEIPSIDDVLANTSEPAQLGTTTTMTISFTDDNATSINIQWNDGFENNYISSSQLTATHIYDLPGVYTVTITITEPCGGTAVYEYKYIVIYDPDGGFVTGGGWFWSPDCAFKDIEGDGVTGKANFGFVAKYKKGKTVPDGNTQFQFKAGDINFHSSAYDDMRLVIAHFKANYTGTGTINGAGNYGFLVSAIDGNIKGDGIDKFRIKIWDKDNGNTVIYDNNCFDEADNADPATAIDGGSITIHDNKKKSAEIISKVEKCKLKVYPNPFTNRLKFKFISPEDTHARIDLFDATGRKVRTLFDNPVKGGVYYNAEFKPTSEVTGMYFYRMTLGEAVYNDVVIYKKE